MNKDIATKWVEKLRSGTIEQLRGNLGSGSARCCLGVLCDIAVKDGIIEKEAHYGYNAVCFGGSSEVLPTSVMDWAGMVLGNAVGLLELEDGTRMTLADLNDAGLTFAQIADVIERYVKQL